MDENQIGGLSVLYSKSCSPLSIQLKQQVKLDYENNSYDETQMRLATQVSGLRLTLSLTTAYILYELVHLQDCSPLI